MTQQPTVYDYNKQAWVADGRYLNCGHQTDMTCRCYGRLHTGETVTIHYGPEKCAVTEGPHVEGDCPRPVTGV